MTENVLESNLRKFHFQACQQIDIDNLPLGELAGHLPGWIHLNKLDDLSIFWMSEKMENDLQSSSQEAVNEGLQFVRSIIQSETETRVVPQILSYLTSADEDEVLGFIQMIRQDNKQPYKPYYTTIKMSTTYNCLFCQSLPLLNYKKKVGEYINLYGYDKQLAQDFEKYQRLTKREKEVLKLIANGETNKSTGEILRISALTVKTHRQNILNKLDSNRIQDMVRIAMAFGLK